MREAHFVPLEFQQFDDILYCHIEQKCCQAEH